MIAGLQLLIAALATGVIGRVFFGKPWTWVPRAIGRAALRLVPFAGKHSAVYTGVKQTSDARDTVLNVRRNLRRAVLALAPLHRNRW